MMWIHFLDHPGEKIQLPPDSDINSDDFTEVKNLLSERSSLRLEILQLVDKKAALEIELAELKRRTKLRNAHLHSAASALNSLFEQVTLFNGLDEEEKGG